MKCSSFKSVGLLRLRHYRFVKVFCSVIAVLTLLVPCASSAQTPVHHPSSTQKPTPQPSELDARLAAARAARDSGDPAAAQLANERLIALALSGLARLRMAQQAYPQAVELYDSSL